MSWVGMVVATFALAVMIIVNQQFGLPESNLVEMLTLWLVVVIFYDVRG